MAHLEHFFAWRFRGLLAAASGLRDRLRKSRPVKRVLCVLEGGVGDKLMALPAIRHLRDSHPDARLVIQSIGVFPDGMQCEADEWFVTGKHHLRERIRLADCDELFVNSIGIFDMRNEVAALFSRAAVRRGPRFAHMKEGGTSYNRSFVFGSAHETVVNLLGAGGRVEDGGNTVAYPFQPPVIGRFRRPPSDFTIGLHVACHPASAIKQWSPDNFREVILAFPDVRFRLIGQASEAPLMNKVAAGFGNARVEVCSTGEAFHAAVGSVSVFVGNDSGLCHLAAALTVPVVTIMGPTDPAKCGPVGPTSRIVSAPCEKGFCYWTGAECSRCIDRVAPDQVVAAIRALAAGL